MLGAVVAGNTYFGTLSLLEEATADEACDRNAFMWERALNSLAAFAKQKVPATQSTLKQACAYAVK